MPAIWLTVKRYNYPHLTKNRILNISIALFICYLRGVPCFIIVSAIWKIISVILTSSVKFLLALPLARAEGLNYWETVFATSVGGILGVLIFYFLFSYFLDFYHRQRHKYKVAHKKPPKPKTKRIFTRRNRFIVRIMQKYGLAGIAFVTPCIISIPIGCFIAARVNQKFSQNNRQALLYLIYSVIGWSFFLTTAFHFLPVLFMMFID